MESRKNSERIFSAKKTNKRNFRFKNKNFSYLDRGTKTLSFRIPKNKNLQNLLSVTGPLIAPSANTEGLPPSKNIKEAKIFWKIS